MIRIASPRNDDAGIESELQVRGLTAPRVTPIDIEANIVGEHYFTGQEGSNGAAWPEAEAPEHESLKLLTICVLLLRNGFSVIGHSACASPANFDPDIGRRLARAKAVEQIWPLMGYELRSRLHDAETNRTLD
jgi:hypothetical protein